MDVCVFLTEGFETIEAFAVLDILRRADIKTSTISITGNICVTSAQGVKVEADSLFDEYEKYPLITKQRLYYEAMEEILPGIKLYIVDENTGVQTALPLSPFASVDMGGEN